MTLVITGTAMTCSLGDELDQVFESMCAGKSGRSRLQAFNEKQYKTHWAYEVPDRSDHQDRDFRATSWLCDAVARAVAQSQLPGNVERITVVVGTGLRELRTLELHWLRHEPIALHHLHFGSALKRHFGDNVHIITLANACAASVFALAVAESILMAGEADAVIAAGCDSITESMFGLIDRLNPESPEQVQPFEQTRKGVLMGEGAAAVVLELPEHAAKRGAVPVAELLSIGVSCDASHETIPDWKGMHSAMRQAHERAGIQPANIDLLLVHGTGTQQNDVAEAKAISTLFSGDSPNVNITALKSMIGHTSGASGLIGVVAACECLLKGRILPTLGLHQPIGELAGFNFVHETACDAPLNTIQVNAFGFGGVNAVAVLSKYRESSLNDA